MILNFTFGVLFLKILFRTRLFWICPHFPVDIIRVFLNFRFSSRKSQSPQKLAKKFPAHFTIQFHSKNLTHFKNLNSLDIENNMLSQHSQKPFWLYKYSNKHILVWCQKKHFHCTISWRPRTALFKHFESKCLYISVYLRKKIFVPETK